MKNSTTIATPESTFLTVAQAAVRMGMSTDDVRILCKTGHLHGARQERKQGPWSIPEEAVDNWLQQRVSNNTYQPKKISVEPVSQPLSSAFSIWLERLRNSRFIVILTTLIAIIPFIFGFISFGADFGSFRHQIRAWGICCQEFAPASDQEILIVIATFHNTAAINTEVHTKIQRAISAEAVEQGEQSLRVAVESSELTADQRSQAEALGNFYNASVVIWGEDTGAEVIVNFLNLKELSSTASRFTIIEKERTQLVNPNAYASFVTTDLPQQMTFFALFATGQAYAHQGNYPVAIKRIEAAVDLLSFTTSPKGLYYAYFALGWLYQSSLLPNLSKAIANYNKAIELDPNDIIAYNNRASVYAEQGNMEAAFADLTKAIELDPNSAMTYGNLGNFYSEQNDKIAAIANYNKAIELDPNNALNYYNRGIVYTDQGSLEAAFADYTKAIELAPDYTIFYINRGNIYSKQGNPQAAIADYTKAIELNPKEPVAYHNRGDIYSEQDDKTAAIADYTKAIELNPNYVSAYYNRGILYTDQGNLEAAITDFRYYLELWPNSVNRIQVEQKITEIEAELAKQK